MRFSACVPRRGDVSGRYSTGRKAKPGDASGMRMATAPHHLAATDRARAPAGTQQGRQHSPTSGRAQSVAGWLCSLCAGAPALVTAANARTRRPLLLLPVSGSAPVSCWATSSRLYKIRPSVPPTGARVRPVSMPNVTYPKLTGRTVELETSGLPAKLCHSQCPHPSAHCSPLCATACQSSCRAPGAGHIRRAALLSADPSYLRRIGAALHSSPGEQAWPRAHLWLRTCERHLLSRCKR
mmetsp:Transcript_46804/g.122886  ORF Transcript_46804/g.122886 Transcript_46804/m.122886 type:complete len:239 (+) Transcript_46804:105-821(+)